MATTMAGRSDADLKARRDRLVLFGCIAVYSLGTLTGWLVPQIVFGTIQRFSVGATAGGLAPTIEGLIAGILSMLLSTRPLPFSLRWLVIAATATWCVVNVTSEVVVYFPLFVGLRALCGVTEAVMMFSATSIAASTRDPDRSYSLMNVVGNMLAAGVIAIWPLLAPDANGLTYLPFVAVVGALMAPFLLLLPRRAAAMPTQAAAQPGGGMLGLPFLLLLVALVLVAFQCFANFTFSIQFGLRVGLSEGGIDGALGLASLLSTIGALAAGFVKDRLGRFGPMMAVLAVAIGFNFWMTHTGSQTVFRVALCVNLVTMFFLQPLFLGWAAELDRTGRSGSVMIGAFFATSAMSPLVIGKLVDLFSVDVLGPLTLVIGGVSAILAILVRSSLRSRDGRPQPASRAGRTFPHA